MIVLTATANYMDRVDVEQSLHMSNAVEIIGNPDGRNIFYSMILRGSDELLSYEAMLRPIADQLLEDKVNYHPLTIFIYPWDGVGLPTALFLVCQSTMWNR